MPDNQPEPTLPVVEPVSSDISDEELMQAARRQIFDPDILLHNFEDNADGIFVVGNGIIEKVNNRAAKLSGYHRSELIGQSHVKHRAGIEADPVDRTMGAHGLETDMRHKNGHSVPVHVSLHSVQTRRGLKFLAQVRLK